MKLQIKTLAGSVLFESEAESIKELLIGAVKKGAYLQGAKGLLPNGLVPLQILGTMHSLIVREVGYITIGCEHHLEWWEKRYRALGRKEDYTPAQINGYSERSVEFRTLFP